MSDRHLNPPDDCRACEEYHVYKDGLCWQCYQDAQEIRAIEREERRMIERMECDDA